MSGFHRFHLRFQYVLMEVDVLGQTGGHHGLAQGSFEATFCEWLVSGL